MYKTQIIKFAFIFNAIFSNSQSIGMFDDVTYHEEKQILTLKIDNIKEMLIWQTKVRDLLNEYKDNPIQKLRIQLLIVNQNQIHQLAEILKMLPDTSSLSFWLPFGEKFAENAQAAVHIANMERINPLPAPKIVSHYLYDY